MSIRLIPRRLRISASVAVLITLVLLAFPIATFAQSRADADGFYQQTNLVSDLPGAQFTDGQLVNPWGLVASSTSPWWIADNGTGLATLDNGQGVKTPLTVTIPVPTGSPAGSTAAPTGVVFSSSGFNVSENGITASSRFIFSTEDGTISGWSPTVDQSHAILEVDRSKVGAGAVYKGLAIGSNAAGTFLFATNFRFGTVEVFDTNFNYVRSFTDPNLPKGYAPFGIQNIGGNLYVTFALQNAAKHDDVAGQGHGFVDLFNTSGHLLRRIASRDDLNSPWGLALAPANFGKFSNDLLVGNFGDGLIHAFNPLTGDGRGVLKGANGVPIRISGLWSLQFGNGAAAGATNELFFTAGIDGEAHGLFGDLQFQIHAKRGRAI
ncbi:MAG TPA: TIGR03118 family protein [Ktedonobacteraceae bacterium]|jgi:uncharacterized protein (TIGR03118 family)|nr:TIGR03118 family protein [Ktedonobacteraceae bacterium]